MQTLAVERGELAKRATDVLKSPEVGVRDDIPYHSRLQSNQVVC